MCGSLSVPLPAMTIKQGSHIALCTTLLGYLRELIVPEEYEINLSNTREPQKVIRNNFLMTHIHITDTN